MTANSSNARDLLGPVDYVVVEFPDSDLSGDGFERLLDLADRRVIQILDVEFLRRTPDTVQQVPVAELPSTSGLDLSVWDGASSGLLDAEDLAVIGEQMSVGALAVVVVFENLWVLDVIGSWPGGRLLFDGGVSADDLVAALDAAESD